MINLKDLTFTIPIRIDTQARVNNVITTIKYLNKHFETNIIIYEDSPSPVVGTLIANNNLQCQYKHIHNTDPLFHRTKLLNLMAFESKTPFIANYDADVLLKVEQYEQAMALLRSNQAEMVFPYNGKFIDLCDNTLETTFDNLDVTQLTEKDGNLIHPSSVGGAIFWNKSTFMRVGMENENFVSWGYEDNERISRTQKLGVKTSRVDGCLFHMHHPVSQNSSNTKHQAYLNNQKEFFKVNAMSPIELLQYIATWEWRQ